jgi:hypothetical protein
MPSSTARHWPPQVTGAQLLEVGDLLPDRRRRLAALADEGRRDADRAHHVPGGVGDLGDVELDVHVAQVVAFQRRHTTEMGFDEQGFLLRSAATHSALMPAAFTVAATEAISAR